MSAAARPAGGRVLIVQCGGAIDMDYPSRLHGYEFQVTTPAAARLVSAAVAGPPQPGGGCAQGSDVVGGGVSGGAGDASDDPLVDAAALTAAGVTVVSALAPSCPGGYNLGSVVAACAGVAALDGTSAVDGGVSCSDGASAHGVIAADGVLVTHDAATMADAARNLAKALGARPGGVLCPVVFAGSRLPERFRRSDAAVNVGVALGALRSPKPLDPGVYVVDNARVVPVDGLRNVEGDGDGGGGGREGPH